MKRAAGHALELGVRNRLGLPAEPLPLGLGTYYYKWIRLVDSNPLAAEEE